MTSQALKHVIPESYVRPPNAFKSAKHSNVPEMLSAGPRNPDADAEGKNEGDKDRFCVFHESFHERLLFGYQNTYTTERPTRQGDAAAEWGGQKATEGTISRFVPCSGHGAFQNEKTATKNKDSLISPTSVYFDQSETIINYQLKHANEQIRFAKVISKVHSGHNVPLMPRKCPARYHSSKLIG